MYIYHIALKLILVEHRHQFSFPSLKQAHHHHHLMNHPLQSKQ